ncbi:hypothetical protein GCM10010406_48270 [Streptomyces thermolineatus]|uniref:HTH-like domain-containing protein n=1 Tax=Streptomyces thermolineatus TaxID=44033 RepID=A0ABN3MR13_9ACTN
MKRICEVLEFNGSSRYKWPSDWQAGAAHQHRDRALAEKIYRVHGETQSTYGPPRVTAELKERSCGPTRNTSLAP